jgi:uncharacterized FlaG/YvyC family protein
MRIDGPSPIPATVPRPTAQEPKAAPAHAVKAAVVKDRIDVQSKPEVDATNVLVEMQPGNVVVYKFIDEASGRLIQQIPSEQMLKISEAVKAAESKKRT